jgi:hypothetical protein
MATKISTQAAKAFLNFENYRNSNTEVRVYDANEKDICCQLFLHGHCIATNYKDKDYITIQNCGYFTKTTKERLNALPNVNIYQKDWMWYLNGNPWNGHIELINL